MRSRELGNASQTCLKMGKLEVRIAYMNENLRTKNLPVTFLSSNIYFCFLTFLNI